MAGGRGALCALCVWLAASGVSAQGQQTDPEQARRDDEARSLFDAGRLALADGRFEEAYEYFERGYELSRRPALLYNMGVAADRLHRYDDALRAFRRYLESGEIPNRTEVERRIEILEEAVARNTTAPPPEEEQPRAEGGGFPLLYSFIVGGAALVTGGLAIGFWVAANDQYAGLENSCGARGCTDAEIGDSGVETSLVLTNVFFVTALVLTAATGATIGIEIALSGQGEETQTSLRVGPGSLALAGRFR